MISYDKYQNKIKRIAAVKNFIVRFRWPFIALFAILLAGSLALMFTKGMITQDLVLPEGVVYGDSYANDIKAPKAFLSDVKYEFKRVKEENSSTKSIVKYALTDSEAEVEQEYEWTSELPTLAGKYLVRTVTKKISGKSYGSPKEFEIATKPIEFIIKSDSVTYGEMPDKYEFSTVSGDRLDKESVRFKYGNPKANSTVVQADENSFKIYNSKGDDVTFCYSISAPKTENEITINPKSANLVPLPLETIYIGEEIAYGDTVYNWKGGDVYFNTKIMGDKLGPSGKPVNAGRYTVEIEIGSVKILTTDMDGNVVDVSNEQYLLTYSTSTIIVNRRPVTITGNSGAKEYDGEPITLDDIKSDGLVSQHKLNSNFGADIIDKGMYTDASIFTIFDKDDNPVTANYNISFNYEIEARKIKLTTIDFSRPYDGTTKFKFDGIPYRIERDGGNALVLQHTVKATYEYVYSDVGSYKNEFPLEIVDENGYSKTANYQFIEKNYGTLTIEKRRIRVTSASTSPDEWTYNGTEQFKREIEKTELLSYIEGDTEALAADEVISVSDYTRVIFYTENPVANKIKCTIRKGNADTTANYDIEYVEGTLIVNKRSLTIITPDDSEYYNGTPLLGTRKLSTPDNLAYGDRLGEATKVASITYVGTTQNITEFDIVSDYWGRSSTGSYDISYTYGELEVKKHSLSVTTASITKVYDGTPLRGDDESYGKYPSFDGIAYGDYYRAYEIAEITDYGDNGWEWNTTQYKIYTKRDGEEKEVTENYEKIIYTYNTLNIIKRPVKITTATKAHEYDGNPFECREFAPEAYSKDRGLLTNLNHSVQLAEGNRYVSVTNVEDGAHENDFEVIIVDKEGRSVTHNYAIAYDNGYISVYPRTILVTTGSEKWTYDGQPHFNTQIAGLKHGKGTSKDDFIEDNVDTATFVSGNELVLTAYEVTEADSYPNECGYFIRGDRETSNYNLLWDYGTLEIEKRPIIVTTGTDTKDYDGIALQCKSFEYEPYKEAEKRGLLNGHNVIYAENNADVTITDVGEVENVFAVVIVDNYGNDLSKNYSIKYEYRYLYVTPRKITIKTATSSAEFDGTPYSDPETDADTVITSENTLVAGHKLQALAGYATVTYVWEGNVPNRVEYTVVNTDGSDLTEFGNRVSDNYKILYDTYGTISRTVRYVLVTSNSGRWTYDGQEHSETGYTSVHLTDGGEGLVLGHSLEPDDSRSNYLTTIINYSSVPTQNYVAYRFKDDKDNKVGSNYSLSWDYGTLSIEKRPIIITTATKDHVYDGNPFSWTNDWTVEGGYDIDGNKLEKGLVANHTLAVVIINSAITNIWENGESGGIANDVEYKVIDGNRDDGVNANYSISYVYGKLSISRRSLTITTHTESNKYSGTAFSYTYFDTETFNPAKESGIVSGYSAVADLSKYYATVTYVHEGNIKNEFSVKIVKGGKDTTEDGHYLSDNYNILYEYGYIYITPFTITVTNTTIEKPYFGDWLYGDDETIFEGLLFADDYCVADKVAKIIDVGTIVNDTTYIIKNGSTVITDSYNIVYTEGAKLTLTPIGLTIKAAILEKFYDGNPLKGTDGKPEIWGLAGDDYLVAYDVSEITNHGSIPNTTQYDIYADRDGQAVLITDNYDIEYTAGTLTVNKRTIWVVSGTATKEYDGQELVQKEGWEITSALKLVDGHTLEAVTWTSVTDVMRNKDGVVTTCDNKVTYRVIVKGTQNSDVDGNYEILYLNQFGQAAYGALLINPRVVRVTTDSYKWVYDGEASPHSKPSETAVHNTGDDGKEAFVLDHYFNGYNYAEIIDVGTKPNTCDYDVLDGKGESVIGNYDLTVKFGELTITPRPIIIETNGATREYDGSPLGSDTYKVEELSAESGLVENHKAVPQDGRVTITEVEQSGTENEIIFIIYDSKGNDVTGNYAIEYQYGKLYITPRVVRITTASTVKNEWYYKGDYYSKTVPASVQHGSYDKGGVFTADDIQPFVKDHNYLLSYEYKAIDAGITLNECEYTVVDAEGKKVVGNYNITYDYGTLVIEKAPLTIVAATLEKTYDGENLYGENPNDYDDDGLLAEISGLVGRDYAVAYDIAKIMDCGEIVNSTKYVIKADRIGGTVDVSDNYEIDLTAGKLKITRRVIWVVSGTGEKEYNGEAQSYTEKYIITGTFDEDGNPLAVGGLVEGHALEAVDPTTKLTNVEYDENGKPVGVPNIVTYRVIVKDDKNLDIKDNSVDSNYVIKYLNAEGKEEYGVFTLIPRKITVTTATDDKDYDGTPLTNTEDATADKLLTGLGHYLYVKEGEDVTITSVTNVYEGEVYNIISRYWVADANGTDISSNYDIHISELYGTLKINPREVSIALAEIDDITYGDEFTGYPAGNADYTYAEGSKKIVEGETLIISVEYQYENDPIEIDENTRLNAGLYSVVVVNKEIRNGLLSNYDINVVDCTFEVIKRELTIKLLEVEGKVYDGIAYEYDGRENYGYKIIEGDTAYDEELIISVIYLLNGSNIGGYPLNAGLYTIKFDEARLVVGDGTIPATNYEIIREIDEVGYEIDKRPLVFNYKVEELTHEYMGEADYGFDERDIVDYEAENIVETDVVTDVYCTTVQDGKEFPAIYVGEYDYTVYTFVIMRADGRANATNNYCVSATQSSIKLKIMPRLITVRVWFEDIAAHDLPEEPINLIEEYGPYGPYNTEAQSVGVGGYGLYSGDIDLIDAVFTVKQNGEEIELKELGIYTISVKLQDKAGSTVFKDNYIAEYVDCDNYEITKRRINVIPKITAEQNLVYNGEKLDRSLLDYDTKHYFSESAGFLYESDRDDYEVVYSLHMVGDASDKDLLDEILQAGTYYLKIKITYVGLDEEQYFIHEECESAMFTVEQRQLFISTFDDEKSYMYNKTAADMPTEYVLYYNDNGVWREGGFVNDDGKDATPVFAFFKDGVSYAKATDAGLYTIKVTRFNSPNSAYISKNYKIVLDSVSGGPVHGKVYIKPVILVVVPVDHSEKYTGSNEIIQLSSSDYEIRYVEGRTDNRLYGDDKLSFRASATLNVRKSYSARITFKEITITGTDGNGQISDITSNYDIVYTYSQFKSKFPEDECPDSLKDITQTSFAALLSFDQRELRVKQPKSPYESVVYGTNKSITGIDTDITSYVLQPSELLAGHTVTIATARVIATDMNTITQWIYRCKVTDSKGDITFAYNVILISESDSYITVTQADLTIEIDYTREELKGMAGTTLSGGYSIAEGKLYYGAVLEVIVGSNGECVADIRTRTGEDHNDRYNVEILYKNSENNLKEAEYASRIQSLLSRRPEIIKKDDISE